MNNKSFKMLSIGFILSFGFHAYTMERVEGHVQKEMVTLQSQDGQGFSIPVRLARLSIAVCRFMENALPDNVMPVLNVDSDTLLLIERLLPSLKDIIDRNPDPHAGHPFEHVQKVIRPLFIPIVKDLLEKQCKDSSEILDRATKLLLAASYLDIRALLVSVVGVIADQISLDNVAREFATRFLFATSEEEAHDEEVRAAKEELRNRGGGYERILELPPDLQQFLLFDLMDCSKPLHFVRLTKKLKILDPTGKPLDLSFILDL